jgi:hypothetical protein
MAWWPLRLKSAVRIFLAGMMLLLAFMVENLIANVAPNCRTGVWRNNKFSVGPSVFAGYEWAEKAQMVFLEFFKANQTAYLDIGANIGLTTIPITKYSNNLRSHCIRNAQ